MNRYLMLTAAALLSSATSVEAKAYCFWFGGDYCDGGRVTTGVGGGALNGGVRAWMHTSNNCAGGISEGYGVLSRTPGLGKVSFMSDDIYAKNYGSYSTAIAFALPKKIRNGEPWTLWAGMNGTTFFEANSGVLTRLGDCQTRAGSHGGKSTLDGLRNLIRAHRKAQGQHEAGAGAR